MNEVNWERDLLPRVLPASWSRMAAGETEDGGAFAHENGLCVIVSAAVELDGKRWLHVSCSRRSRLPSWDDVVAVKNLFVGTDKLAVQVLPPMSRYINIHPNVLHLWHCLDGDPIPDFARGGDSI